MQVRFEPYVVRAKGAEGEGRFAVDVAAVAPDVVAREAVFAFAAGLGDRVCQLLCLVMKIRWNKWVGMGK